MSSTIYTGNGTGQSVTTGVDMSTGDNGGLVWLKSRSAATNNVLYDTVRAATKGLVSNTTASETIEVDGLLSFDASGFSLGAGTGINTNTSTYVAWSFQTNKKATGLTNRNKAYTAHYNTDLGFSIVGYVGDGVDGHEIPHHLGKVPELTILKKRDGASNWTVKSSYIGDQTAGDHLLLETTAALATIANTKTIPSVATISIGPNAAINESALNYISYHFASKSGVCKIGKYIGTGVAGNYVSTEVDGGDAFKPQFVMVKNLTTAENWIMVDSIRTEYNLFANLSGAEDTVNDHLTFVDDGFFCNTTAPVSNKLNDEYIFLAFAETNIDATKAWTDYTYPTTADTISVENNTVVSVANGFNANGQVDTQYEFTGGVTKTYGVGHEDKHYYLYTSKTGTLGESEYRPLIGWDNRNDADKWGVQSPLNASLRTTAKHFDYESETGVALASGDDGTNFAYFAFNKNENDIVGSGSVWSITVTGASQLQYKQNEKRILKSWRLREHSDNTTTPDNFTIEGSDDGYTWTAIDSTYATTDFDTVTNGASLWSPLQDTSANATAYLYHRINITVNNGHVSSTAIAELEFNTILPADYYLAQDGKMYDSTGTPIERTYLAKFKTDSDGNVINETLINYPVAKQNFGDVEVHEDLKVHGNFIHNMACTAMVRFNGAQNPPLEEVNIGGLVVVDIGNYWDVYVPSSINLDKATWAVSGANDSYQKSISRTDNNILSVVVRQDGGTYSTAELCVQIFGGKS
jgi:hypothetical protein